MINPTVLARRVATQYFAARGEETPEARAERLLNRVTVNADHRWTYQVAVDAAYDILVSAAFDIDDLAENHLRVGLSIGSLRSYDERAGASVFGLAYPKLREITICERAEAYLPLYRATVAHELGHILMEHRNARTRQLAYAPAANRRPGEERIADEFMCSLLLPGSVLTLAIAVASQQYGLSLRETMAMADSKRGRWQWRYRLFRPLVERLCVSRQMLTIAMRRLGCFTEDTAKYHLTYHLPNKWRTHGPVAPMQNIINQIWRDLN